MSNKVYIATSLDGYIADSKGSVDWLPAPDSEDLGFEAFMESIDALVMGRNTFELVLSFGGEWFYSKKVFVVSTSLQSIPTYLEGKVELINETPQNIVSQLASRGYQHLYIDGGKTIQRFLQEDLIDELTITTIPILLGGGSPLFGQLQNPMHFKHTETKAVAGLVQSRFLRDRA